MLNTKSKAILRKFVKEDDLTVSKKVDIMMTHFTQQSMHLIDGKAKAMVVTSSRPLAVKYRRAIDKWISENDFAFKALVLLQALLAWKVMIIRSIP